MEASRKLEKAIEKLRKVTKRLWKLSVNYVTRMKLTEGLELLEHFKENLDGAHVD